jgi:hypothetical protein
MRVRPLLCLVLSVAAACDHSDPFSFGSRLGPASAGSDVLLTYNSNQDYWPAWTEDGSGILYAFVDASQHDPILFGHRCVGLMPAAGGTRFWQWCDNRANQGDSLSSIPAFALGADGRLIYLEATTATRAPFAASNTVLWLADSAFPYRRRALATLPVPVGDSAVSWLADLQWTGPTTFVALGQQMLLGGHCRTCSGIDTVFYGKMVVAGTIGANGATLVPIAGTAGATGYSFAESGASIVFTRRDSTNLMKVPASGGVPSAITVTPRTGVQLLGVSCRGTTCVAALGPVTLWQGLADVYPSINGGAFELRRVSLATGEATTILSRSSILASPLLSPAGDVVAQVGSMFGHLQTFAAAQVDLHRYQGLVP